MLMRSDLAEPLLDRTMPVSLQPITIPADEESRARESTDSVPIYIEDTPKSASDKQGVSAHYKVFHEEFFTRRESHFWTSEPSDTLTQFQLPPGKNATQFKGSQNDDGLIRYRFCDRRAPFGQSHGRINFFRGVSKDISRSIQKLYFTDWYHTFLNFKLRWQVLFFTITLLSLWTSFAVLIYLSREQCGIDNMNSFLDAYYFSIETLETIGYGTKDVFFNGCWQMAVILSLQAMITTVLNAFLIGVIFSRLARPQSRAATVIFSNKALVQYNEFGAPHLVFRVADLRHHQLIEGHIRCYCIVHDNAESDFQRCGLNIYPLRLSQPDDALGGMLLMTAPQIVIHRIDIHSPLSPYFRPTELRPVAAPMVGRSPNFEFQTHVPGCIPQRIGDADTGNRVSFMCDVCGNEYSSFVALKKHVAFEKACHGDYSPRKIPEATEDELRSHWHGKSFEVFVVCEGIEPFTSCTVQARHSYVMDTDVLFGHSFFPCVRVSSETGICLFDVTRFHKTMDFRSIDGTRSMHATEAKILTETEPTVLRTGQIGPLRFLTRENNRTMLIQTEGTEGQTLQGGSPHTARSPISPTSPYSMAMSSSQP